MSRIGRRGFLKGLAVGTAAAGTTVAASKAVAGGGVHRFPGYAGTKGLLHDTTLCVGCRSCEQACNDVHDLGDVQPPPQDPSSFDETRLISDNQFTVVNRYREAQGNTPAVYRKHQCMHCQEPCCASVCFVEAFTKTPEGPILYDPDVCVGCRYCVFACPYYALAYEYDEPLSPRVMRCTMCHDRIVEGQAPGCADACPTGAILYGEREELLNLARERMRQSPGRYAPTIYGEHDFAGTSWLTISSLPAEDVGLFDNVSHAPLPDLTTGFLALAPIVAAIFPGLLGGFYAMNKRRERMNKDELRDALKEQRVKSVEELEARLEEAAKEAVREKNYAVERAIRDTLRRGKEAQAKAAAEAEAAAKAPPVEGERKAPPPDTKGDPKPSVEKEDSK